jgi:hypothetical protein
MTQITLHHAIFLPPFRPMEELQDVSFEVCQGELALLVGPIRIRSAFWLEENSGQQAGGWDAMAKCGFFVRLPVLELVADLGRAVPC